MEKTLRSSTAFGRWLPESGLDVTLRLQTLERGVDGADRDFTTSPCLNLLPHSDPIGPISKTKEGQYDDMLKFSKIISI
jgi:hypothetical protein